MNRSTRGVHRHAYVDGWSLVMTTNSARIASIILLGIVIALGAGCATSSHSSASKSNSSGQRSFDSPQQAVDALVDATRRQDRAALKSLFGPEAERLASADIRQKDIDFQRFTGAYDAAHSLVANGDGYILYAGSADWWFPAPIIRDGQRWRFDTVAGVDEILNRTIGLNELHAIDACAAFERAEQQYFEMDPDGDGVHAYAEKIRSDPGKRNGLFWPEEPGAPASPIGPAMTAAAHAGDLALDKAGPQPYRGYYYKVLTRQTGAAPGGAMNYIDASGHMTGGFALLVWPAAYGETGVMSFMVSKDGRVFQNDLGESTDAKAKAYTAFDPTGWDAVETGP